MRPSTWPSQAEWGRIVATLIRLTGDWDLAEECAQDAFATAAGAVDHRRHPAHSGAWLTTVARNRAIDRLRRARGRSGQTRRSGAHALRRRRAHTRRGPVARRPAGPDVHLLPPGPLARGPGGAHAAHPGRTDHGRDRPGLLGGRTDHGAATGAGQAQDRATPASRSGSRPTTSWSIAPEPSWPCSTCSSTRATRPVPGPTWFAED